MDDDDARAMDDDDARAMGDDVVRAMGSNWSTWVWDTHDAA